MNSQATLIVKLTGDFTTEQLQEIIRTQFPTGTIAPPCLGGGTYEQNVTLHSAVTLR